MNTPEDRIDQLEAAMIEIHDIIGECENIAHYSTLGPAVRKAASKRYFHWKIAMRALRAALDGEPPTTEDR